MECHGNKKHRITVIYLLGRHHGDHSGTFYTISEIIVITYKTDTGIDLAFSVPGRKRAGSDQLSLSVIDYSHSLVASISRSGRIGIEAGPASLTGHKFIYAVTMSIDLDPVIAKKKGSIIRALDLAIWHSVRSSIPFYISCRSGCSQQSRNKDCKHKHKSIFHSTRLFNV